MEKQIIISVGREFGSGGHLIAKTLADRFRLPFYDNNLLEKVAVEKRISHEQLKKYDEKPINKFLSRTVAGHTNSMQENIANMQFDYLKKKAASGSSFVVVGRCAESILKDYDCLISFFINGDKDVKLERIKRVYNLSEEDARRLMQTSDLRRKSYHNYFCKGKWGDSRNYDLVINSSSLGLDKTINVLEKYIQERMS